MTMVFHLAFGLAISAIFLYQGFRCLNLMLHEQPIKTIFDGSNFEIWSQEMSSFLKGCELWPYVTGDTTRPVINKGEDVVSYKQRLEDWNTKNHQILTAIRSSCASSVKPRFDRFETAKEVWDFLSESYSIAKQYRLCEKLSNFKQQKGQALQGLLSDMQVIWDKLARFEPVLSCSDDAKKFAQYQEKVKVVLFLMALHEDYEYARACLLRRGKTFFKLESIVSELCSEENRLGIPENRQTNSVVCSGVLQTASTDQQSSQLCIGSSLMPSTVSGRAKTCSELNHWCHPHPLGMVPFEGLYTCKGCKMDGMGRRYRCNDCDFNLHEECMFASPMITFQGRKYEFFMEPPKGRNCSFDHRNCRFCDACGKLVKGFVYHCVENDMDLHPKCAKLPSDISVRDVKFTLREGAPCKCQWCGNKWLKGTENNIPGWSYVSNKNGCDFHVYCFMEMAKQKLCTRGKGLTKGGLGMKKTQQTISKRRGRRKHGRFWLKIIKIFLNTVFSILLGDPTGLLVSTVAHIVTESLNIG